mmetsp:Transcript_9727/g.14870  ORF Transcript_9727/g.14870 Transcript_9727/m.14870 type:complete len:797 (+) Transcript_9727:64-2454(+)
MGILRGRNTSGEDGVEEELGEVKVFRDRLKKLHHQVAIWCVLLFIAFVLILPFVCAQKIKCEDDPVFLRILNACAAASFITTMIRTGQALLMDLDSSFLSNSPSEKRKKNDDYKRDYSSDSNNDVVFENKNNEEIFDSSAINSVRLVTISINFVAAIAHSAMAIGFGHIVIGPNNRRVYMMRIAEWLATIPVMMTLLHTYDLPSCVLRDIPYQQQEQRKIKKIAAIQPINPSMTSSVSTCQNGFNKNQKVSTNFQVQKAVEKKENVLSIVKNAISSRVLSCFFSCIIPTNLLFVLNSEAITSIGCQTLSVILGLLTVIIPNLPLLCIVFLYVLACFCYLNIFFVLRSIYQSKENVKEDKRIAIADRRIHDFTTLLATYEAKSRSKRAFTLVLGCAILWTIIALVWFGGLMNLYSTSIENSILSITDVLSKNLFVCALGEEAIKADAISTTLQQLLKIEKASTKQRRRFLRFVMHEVRVPLNAVKLGLTSVADIIDASSSNVTVNDVSKNNYDDDEEYNLKKKEKNEIIETLRYVDGAIDGMAETLNDVLSFAAIEEGRFRLNCSQFNVNKLLKNAQATHLPTAEEKQISIEVHIDERLQSLILYGDHRRIANCIGNFCSNALKFSTSGGQVLLHASLYDNVQDSDCLNFPPSSTISSSVPETKDCDIIGNNRDDDDDDHSKKRAIGLKIEVRDNGCGIDFNDQRTLFQPFSQIRPGELQQGRGSGLGLAISKESIERHGGSIGLESTPGVGSTFFIHVPLAIISENIDNASSQSLNNETNSQSSSLKIQDEKKSSY